jgi:hypothetical protein
MAQSCYPAMMGTTARQALAVTVTVGTLFFPVLYPLPLASIAHFNNHDQRVHITFHFDQPSGTVNKKAQHRYERHIIESYLVRIVRVKASHLQQHQWYPLLLEIFSHQQEA